MSCSPQKMVLACVLFAGCSRWSSATSAAGADAGAVTAALTVVPPLPPGDPALPRWDELCQFPPRSKFTDWGDVLVITPDHKCFKDMRRSSPRIVRDAQCSSGCGKPIQCPPPGPLRPDGCFTRAFTPGPPVVFPPVGVPAAPPMDLGPMPPAWRGSRDVVFSPLDIAASGDDAFVTWSASRGGGTFAEEVAITRYSTSGEPETVAQLKDEPFGVVVIDRRVHYATKDGIFWVATTGGRPTLVTHRTGLLVGRFGSELAVLARDGKAIWEVSDAGNVRAIATGDIGFGKSTATHYFGITGDPAHPVARVSLADGTIDRIGEKAPSGFVYQELVVNTSDVAAILHDTSRRDYIVYSVSRDRVLARDARPLKALAAGSRYVYVGTHRDADASAVIDGDVYAVPFAGGPAVPVVASAPFAAATADGRLFLLEGDGVRAVPVFD